MALSVKQILLELLSSITLFIYVQGRGPIQNLETAKIGSCKFFGVLHLKEDYSDSKCYHIFTYNSLIQCYLNFIEVNKINYMLEIDILRNFSQEK